MIRCSQDTDLVSDLFSELSSDAFCDVLHVDLDRKCASSPGMSL